MPQDPERRRAASDRAAVFGTDDRGPDGPGHGAGRLRALPGPRSGPEAVAPVHQSPTENRISSMMEPPLPEDERYRLLAAWCDGTISKAEAERLDELVCTDAEFRSFYRAYMGLHGLLAAEVHRFPGQLLPEPPGRSDAVEVSKDVDGGAAAPGPTFEIRRRSTGWHRLAGVWWPWR